MQPRHCLRRTSCGGNYGVIGPIGPMRPIGPILLLQPAVEPLVGHLADVSREVVLAVGVVRGQLLLRAEQVVKRTYVFAMSTASTWTSSGTFCEASGSGPIACCIPA